MFRGRKLVKNNIFSNNHQCNYTKTSSRPGDVNIGDIHAHIHVAFGDWLLNIRIVWFFSGFICEPSFFNYINSVEKFEK